MRSTRFSHSSEMEIKILSVADSKATVRKWNAVNRRQLIDLYKFSKFQSLSLCVSVFLSSSLFFTGRWHTHWDKHIHVPLTVSYTLFAFKSIYFLPENEKNKQKEKNRRDIEKKTKQMKKKKQQLSFRCLFPHFLSFSLPFDSLSLILLRYICWTLSLWCL